MGNNGFESGKVYKSISFYRFSSYTPFVGVREEKINGVDYFTFFSLVHDIFAAQNMSDFSFQRKKIMPSDFLSDEDGLILIRPRGEVKNIWYGEKKDVRNDFMNSWLEECRRILDKFGAVRVDDIFRGKRTWGCEDEMYKIFGDGSGSMSLRS